MRRMIVKKELVLKRMFSETTLSIGTPVEISVTADDKNIRVLFNLKDVIVRDFMTGKKSKDKQNDYFYPAKNESIEIIKEHFRNLTEMELNCEKYNI